MSTLERIADIGLVPVVRIEPAEDAPALARTLSEAGLPCIEITFRSDAAADAIRAIQAEVPEMLVGAKRGRDIKVPKGGLSPLAPTKPTS